MVEGKGFQKYAPTTLKFKLRVAAFLPDVNVEGVEVQFIADDLDLHGYVAQGWLELNAFLHKHTLFAAYCDGWVGETDEDGVEHTP